MEADGHPKPDKTARDAISRLLKHLKPQALARKLGINSAHIYRGRSGDITPTLETALVENGYLPEPETRDRFCGDVGEILHGLLNQECERLGLTHGQLLHRMYVIYDNALPDRQMNEDDNAEEK